MHPSIDRRTLPVLLAALWPVAAGLAQQNSAPVEAARTALEKWVETRRLITQEKRDWMLGKELLGDRIAVVQREIDTLRASIADARKSAGDAEGRQRELVAEKERLDAATATLRATVQPLEARTRQLLARVPDHLRERVKPLSQLIPDQPEQTRQSLGERYRNVVGVVNELDKFQRDISVASEVRVLGDGTTAEVTSLYLGLGHAFYVNGAGNAAGAGTAAGERWVWTPIDEAAAGIRSAVKVLGNEQVAAFVQLPVRIQ